MKQYKVGLLSATAGFAAGIALILSCGDNTSESDAAVAADAAPSSCDCPAPVPFESRLREVRVTETLSATDTYRTVTASCGTIGLPGKPTPKAIGGHCAGLITSRNLPLVDGGTFLHVNSHGCTWRNPDGLANIELTATVICVLPEDYPPDYLLDAGVR